jgi:hypothetical protein
MVEFHERIKIEELVLRHFGEANVDRPLTVQDFDITEDGVVNVNVNCYMRRRTQDGRLPVQFGTIDGDFSLASMRIVSLEGSPQVVEGNFDCSFNQLTSLQHCPQSVMDFDCSNNPLTTLQWCPRVPAELLCDNAQLRDLTSVPPATYLSVQMNPIVNFRNTPSHIQEVAVTWHRDLPLLGLLTVAQINIHRVNGAHYAEVENILKKYAGEGKRGVIRCQKELISAGFEGNARW